MAVGNLENTDFAPFRLKPNKGGAGMAEMALLFPNCALSDGAFSALSP